MKVISFPETSYLHIPGLGLKLIIRYGQQYDELLIAFWRDMLACQGVKEVLEKYGSEVKGE